MSGWWAAWLTWFEGNDLGEVELCGAGSVE